jgi:hypothetical protein
MCVRKIWVRKMRARKMMKKRRKVTLNARGIISYNKCHDEVANANLYMCRVCVVVLLIAAQKKNYPNKFI